MGHDAARVIRAGLAVTVSMMLAACASAPLESSPPQAPLVAPAAPDAADASAVAEPPPDPSALMVYNALSLIGQPYRFGGAEPGGFDCSGLVAYAAAGAGIYMPRTAREQLGAGMPVQRGQLQAGDLVFMHLARKELHVGIAIDGDRFVHAPSSGGYVRIDSLASAPYARGYLGARRIIAAR
jgi:cell wall-associated NlpC family hydrolase